MSFVFVFVFKEGAGLRFLSQENKDDCQLTWPFRKQKMKFKMASSNHRFDGKIEMLSRRKALF